MAAMTTQQNYTMARLLAFDFAKDPQVLDLKDEYMFGPALLVCPVTAPSDSPKGEGQSHAGVVMRKTYLPQDTKWYDYWTNQTYAGGQWIDAAAPLNQLPLFVRAGSIIPMGPDVQYDGEKSWQSLNVRVYPGADGSFTLYEDEGDNYNYETRLYTEIPFQWNEATRTLTIGKRSGHFPGYIANRTFVISLPDGTTKSVKYSGSEKKVKL